MAEKRFSCSACGKSEFDSTIQAVAESLSLGVCPSCAAHARLEPRERLAWLADSGSFVEFDDTLRSLNPIDMAGYEEKLTEAQAKASENEAVVTGRCNIEGRPVIVALMSFRFMGGSMGSVVGEKITRAMGRGADEKLPVFVFATSGGARMQEGIFSLMQMAKTSAAAADLEEAGLPLFIVLCDPTTGGVTASFAMLGNVIIAEPGALIGFAGARVIEGTIRQKLPEGFQRAEFQLNHGFVDAIVPRDRQRKTFAFLIDSHARRQ
jgi:acetyl-CoA carboxylase carboxyl transferase subunit beta